MFYFGVGGATEGHADILIAFSEDLMHWDKDTEPLYKVRVRVRVRIRVRDRVKDFEPLYEASVVTY